MYTKFCVLKCLPKKENYEKCNVCVYIVQWRCCRVRGRIKTHRRTGVRNYCANLCFRIQFKFGQFSVVILTINKCNKKAIFLLVRSHLIGLWPFTTEKKFCVPRRRVSTLTPLFPAYNDICVRIYYETFERCYVSIDTHHQLLISYVHHWLGCVPADTDNNWA